MKKQLILILLLLTGTIYGEDLQISASISSKQTPLNTPITYEITLYGDSSASVPSPTLPNFNGIFSVIGTSESNSFRIINNKMSSSLSKRYTLLPNKIGEHTLEPAVIKYNGNVYKTNKITITVTSANNQSITPSTQTHQQSSISQPSSQTDYQPIFAKKHVTKTSAYVGEEIIYTLHLFRRIRLWQAPSHEPLQLENVWKEELPIKKEHSVQNINEKPYYKFELEKAAITALEPGIIQLPETHVSFIADPFQGKTIVTAPSVTITILPLPLENKPKLFTGIVGDFSLSATTNKTDIMQATPITLTIHVEGIGSLQGLTDLQFEETSALKIYKSKTAIQKEEKTIKSFEYIIVPKTAGTKKIPPFSFSYFSPSKKIYQTLQTPSIEIAVAPSTKINASQTTEPEQQNIEQLNKDIQFIQTEFNLSTSKNKISIKLITVAITVISIIIFLYAGLLYIKKHIIKHNPKEELKQQAFQIAINKCQKSKESKNIESFLYNTLIEFFSNKIGKKLTGFTLSDIKKELATNNLNEKDIQLISTVLSNLSHSSYAPTASIESTQTKLTQQTVAIIKKHKTWIPK